ncbi:MAG: hypothetical protein ABIS29_08010 [Vicinamibacterales bacterium]
MPCKLKPIPDTTDFEGPKGILVRLVTKNHIGDVLISSAEYAGRQLVPEGQAVSKIEFSMMSDRRTLKLVAVFSASNGRGELREVDGADSQFLRDLISSDGFQMMRIIGV